MSVLAHGVGSRQDLPIPYELALYGSGVVLVVSFVALAMLWREPRLEADTGRPLPRPLAAALDSAWLRWGLRLLALLAVGYVGLAAFAGPDDDLNPTASVVYVLFWVGLVPASLMFGPVWRVVNPLRTVHAGLAWLFRLDRTEGRYPLPPWVGYWPAAVTLTAFTWLELVSPEGTSTLTLRVAAVLYAAGQLLAGIVFGSGWFARGDGFEVVSSLIGRLAVIGRRGDGVLVWRSPLRGLAGLRPEPGLVATVAVLIGSTAFDSLSSSTAWVDYAQSAAVDPVLVNTLGLLGMIGLVAGSYRLGAPVAATREGPEPARVPGLFVHSLVPIAVGYLVAHYFSLFVFEGQRALILLTDPLGTGADWLGLADRQVDFRLVSVATIAVVQVGAIVAGHVLGVVAAHDRAAALFPARELTRSQLPLLLLMIAYTCGGISLLFTG